MCKVLCFKDAPRGHCGPNPRGSIKRASTYPRPDEVRVGDLYRSERSERRSDSTYPTHHARQHKVMYNFLWGGWVARPSAFYFCIIAGSLSYAVRSVFRWRFALLRLTVLGYVFPVTRVPFGRPCPFLVCLSFPPCLVHAIHTVRKHALHIYALFIHLIA